MLQGEDIQSTKRNDKQFQEFKQSQKNLFQINEDEEEEPLSASKQNYSDIQIDDTNTKMRKLDGDQNPFQVNMNITNLSKDQKLIGKRLNYDQESLKVSQVINDPPQFCSSSKHDQENQIPKTGNRNDENKTPILLNAYSQAQLSSRQLKSQLGSYIQRPRSHLKLSKNQKSNKNSMTNIQTQGAFSDSTTFVDPTFQINQSSKMLLPHPSYSDKQDLNQIKEFNENDIEKQNVSHRSQATNQPTNRQSLGNNQVCLSLASKEESKDEDSSRILMMKNAEINSCSRESLIGRNDNNKTTKDRKLEILTILVLLLVICGATLSCGYVIYSFYNMTASGLKNALAIFGLSMLLDLLVFRLLFISLISILTTNQKIKAKQLQINQNLQFEEIDDEYLSLLGEIYEDYDTPVQFVASTLINHNSKNFPTENYKSLQSQQKLQEINPLDNPEYQATNLNQQRSPETSPIKREKAQYQEYQLFLNLKQQQNQSLNEKINNRILKYNKINPSKRTNFGEIVVVESSYFYHQPQNMPLSQIKHQVNQYNEEIKSQIRQPSPEKKKRLTLGERLKISQTFQFNAVEEELRMRKAHAEKLKAQHQDQSNYDIEEIQMQSAQKKDMMPEYINPCNDQEMNLNNVSDSKNLILPSIFGVQQQFETPKGLNDKRFQFQVPQMGDVRTSHQIITFNDMRESKQDISQYQLKDLLASGNSNSSKKQKNLLMFGKDYQSLQRYLDEDKENQNSSNKKGRYSLDLRSSLQGSNNRQNKYIEPLSNMISPQYQDPQTLNVQMQDELIKFTPQYSSLNKGKSLQNQNSQKSDIKRQSLVQADMFSDLKGKTLISDLVNSQNKRSLQNSAQSKKGNRASLNVKNLLNTRKSIQSPSSIKENLEEKMNKLNQNSILKQSLLKSQNHLPDISPFHANRLHQIQDESYIEAPTMNMPSPRDFNVMQSLDFNMPVFNQVDQADQDQQLQSKFRQSTNSNLRQFLQPQLMKQKSIEKQKKRKSKVNNITTEGSQNDLTMQLNFQNDVESKREKNITEASAGIVNTDDDKEKIDIIIEKKPKIKAKGIPQHKNQRKRIKESMLSENFMLDNTFQTDANCQLKRESSDNIVDHAEYGTNKSIHEQILNDISRNIHNKSEGGDRVYDEQSFKSKMFEDSDSSTIKIIKVSGMGSRQRSKQDMQTYQNFQTEISSQGGAIDFYSNPAPIAKINTSIKDEEIKGKSKQAKEYKTNQGKQKKQIISDVIFEENHATHNSSPEKNTNMQVLFGDDQTSSLEKSLRKSLKKKQRQTTDSHQSNDNQLQYYNEEASEFNLMDQMKNLQSNQTNRQHTDESFEGNATESDFAQTFASKKQQLHQRFRSKLRSDQNDKSKQTKDNRDSDSDQDYQFKSNTLKQQEELRKKKEDNEILMFRIEEQRRKLKNFLKLAKQLKSTKDEKKIKEFLKYLKTEQKPLPYQKINELKSLEIMSSPYNQSLIDMIKDEYDQFKRTDRKSQNDLKPKKPSKSQIRNEIKTGQVINKLNNIYGQQVGNSSFSTNRKDSRSKSRGESQKLDYRSKNSTSAQANKLIASSRQKMSRDSSDSTLNDMPIQQFKKRQQRNNMIVLDQNSTNSFISNEGISRGNATGEAIKIEDFRNTATEEAGSTRTKAFGNFKNQILEIRDSVEFNNLEDYI
eukprot:403368653